MNRQAVLAIAAECNPNYPSSVVQIYLTSWLPDELLAFAERIRQEALEEAAAIAEQGGGCVSADRARLIRALAARARIEP